MAGAVTVNLESPLAILRHHAKSFFWASLFLPREKRLPIAELYAFCRRVDDIADTMIAESAKSELQDLRQRVLFHQITYNFEAQGIREEWLLDLLDGALADTTFVSPRTELELDQYCYQVAGVVGLMMCPLLGVKDESAWQHAVDLGTAMQLTNIARDVAEDFANGRVYFPETWRQESDLPSKDLLRDPHTSALVRRLLNKAEPLYKSGRQGLSAIPWRTRLSIAVALEIYRDIGRSLEQQQYDPQKPRAYVRLWRKIYLSARAVFKLFFKEMDNDLSAHNYAWRRQWSREPGSGDL